MGPGGNRQLHIRTLRENLVVLQDRPQLEQLFTRPALALVPEDDAVGVAHTDTGELQCLSSSANRPLNEFAHLSEHGNAAGSNVA